MKCNLESCTGTAIIEWEAQILSHIPKGRRLVYIEQNSPRLREIYCSEVCPVAKFNKKYPKLEHYNLHDAYIFEGGIDEHTR
jgi:hypothetical protein